MTVLTQDEQQALLNAAVSHDRQDYGRLTMERKHRRSAIAKLKADLKPVRLHAEMDMHGGEQ